MPRAPRDLQPGCCYHVTVRCNNREFRLSDRACREVLALPCLTSRFYGRFPHTPGRGPVFLSLFPSLTGTVQMS